MHTYIDLYSHTSTCIHIKNTFSSSSLIIKYRVQPWSLRKKNSSAWSTLWHIAERKSQRTFKGLKAAESSEVNFAGEGVTQSGCCSRSGCNVNEPCAHHLKECDNSMCHPQVLPWIHSLAHQLSHCRHDNQISVIRKHVGYSTQAHFSPLEFLKTDRHSERLCSSCVSNRFFILPFDFHIPSFVPLYNL